MANIDTSTIQGFDTMTAEDKVNALLRMEIPDKVDLTGYIAKSQFDKVSSELADAKKQLKSKMSEDEAKKAEDDQARLDMEEKYNALLKKSTIAEHTSRFLALGYEEKLARETAEALFDGDMEKVFLNQQKANEAIEKKIRADLMKQEPRPSNTSGGNEDATVEWAKALAASRNASRKASEDVMKYYAK